MKWLLDEGIPRRLAAWLRERGEDVLVVAESEYRSQPDHVLWTLAGREGMIVVTRDRGFVFPSLAPAPAGLVVLRPAAEWRAEAMSLFLWDALLRLGFETLPGKVTVLEPGRVRQRPLPRDRHDSSS